MKKGLCVLTVLFTLAACNDGSVTLTVKGDSIGRELDTLGSKIEENAERVGDSVKAKYNDIKEAVKSRLDSISREKDTIR